MGNSDYPSDEPNRNAHTLDILFDPGFWLGVAISVGGSVYQAWSTSNYTRITYSLIFQLLWVPWLVGWLVQKIHRIRMKQSEPLRATFSGFRIGTLMLIIAYFAIVMGAYFSTIVIQRRATLAIQKRQQSQSMIAAIKPVYAKLSAESDVHAQNAALLHAMKIPEDLTSSQKDFLKSLEAGPQEFRKHRFEIMEQSESETSIYQKDSLLKIQDQIDYFEAMFLKYDEAFKHPWNDIEPDLPVPHQK
jgi:hypothetical protein